LAIPNPTSLSEGTSTIIFPNEQNVVDSIPLWMKFFCYEYSSSSIGRAASYARSQGSAATIATVGSNLKQIIAVPAPANFVSTTSNAYTTETSRALSGTDQAIALVQGASKSVLGGILDKFGLGGVFGSKSDKAITRAAGILKGVRLAGNILGYNQLIETDYTDQVYKPGGQIRQFDVNLYLPCLSQADSEKAGNIIRAFEALSLPTVISAAASKLTFFFHPPLWIFGVGALDSYKFDSDWSGTPQLSVLKIVKSKRIAIDTTSIGAISEGNGYFKPMAYTVTLVFQELEPAIRITAAAGGQTSLQISNRSGAVVTTGSQNTAAIASQF
jgi:hypothetical protein